MLCKFEQLAQFFFVQSCADYGYHACGLGFAVSDLALARHIVKLHPSAVAVFDYTLGSQDLTVLIEAVDNLFELCLYELG